MPVLRQTRSLSPLLATVVLASVLAAASCVVPAPANADLPPAGFTLRPMINSYGDRFAPSVVGNPVTDSGLVAGSTLVGRYSRAAVYDLHRHTLTVLGTLGGRNSYGADVNASGDVVGYSELTFRGEVHAFLWTAKTGVIHDLGAFDGRGSYSQASSINDAGVVVGWGTLKEGGTGPRAFVWDTTDEPAVMRELPLPAGASLSVANAINAKGQVVGRAAGDGVGSSTGDEGFLWDPTTGDSSALASPPGADVLGAVDINDAGFVVGPAQVTAVGPYGTHLVPRSYRWNPATRTSTLIIEPPGSDASDTRTEVSAINRHGIIVGVATRDRARRLVVWNECGTPVYLRPGSTDQESSASGVNRYGEIVGTATTSPTAGASFVRAEPCTATR